MPKFRSLTHFPQQFFADGQIWILHPGEVKEFPESFIGRYNGLIELIPEDKKPEDTSELEKYLEEHADELVEEVSVVDEDDQALINAVKKANEERKDVVINAQNSKAYRYVGEKTEESQVKKKAQSAQPKKTKNKDKES